MIDIKRSLPNSILLTVILIGVTVHPATAGEPFFHRRGRAVVQTVAPMPRPQDRVAPTGMLGSFVPAPYVSVQSNGTLGGGYTPLGFAGRESSLSVYGPLSAFRQISAPVDTVVRGYDGAPTIVRGTSFSNPTQPDISPYVYPTRASNYSALPFQGSSPRRDRATMWIDQN